MDLDEAMADLEYLKKDIFAGKAINFKIGRRRTQLPGRGYRIKGIRRWRRGDSFSSIDWQLTLPTWPETIYKLERLETKEVPVFVVVDTSPSVLLRFSDQENKFRLMLRLMATLGLSGNYLGDPVGVAAFGSVVNFFLPLRHGSGQIFYAAQLLIEEANGFYEVIQRKKRWTEVGLSIGECLSSLLGRLNRQSMVFIISDFMDMLYGRVEFDKDILAALVAKHPHNVVLLMLDDQFEFSWSGLRGSAGTLMTRDVETGQLVEIKSKHAQAIRQDLKKRRSHFQKKMEDLGIDSLVVSSRDYLTQLADFAASRQRGIV